ncbi:unnamed protein product [Rodentolepis nana]|uniref:Secreted protein n=1 Tax=Rodentolepis nana TaxID=102285 RepID=A0A0R3TV27_RODNA|nr:unnamed protein product [Rodentolepis nana]
MNSLYLLILFSLAVIGNSDVQGESSADSTASGETDPSDEGDSTTTSSASMTFMSKSLVLPLAVIFKVF